MSWAEALGMDKPRQRKRSRCVVIPSPERKLLNRRPTGAVCWDGCVGRNAHEWDRDGRCYFCRAERAWEPI